MVLKDKVALVTGGSKGIGYGVAREMIEQGMNVVLTSRNAESAERAATRLNETGPGRVLGLAADVRSLESQEAAVQKALTEFGRLDAVIANAGVGHYASIEDLTPEQWNEMIDTNLTGVFYSIKAGLKALEESKGYFITISSLAGVNFMPRGSGYNASKFGVTGFTQAVMLDVRDRGIRVSTVMPGSVATYFNGQTPGEKDAWKIQPEDIGRIVIDLLTMNPRTLPSKVEVRPSIPVKRV